MLIDYLYLKFYGVEVNFGDVKLYGFPIIRKHKGSSIKLKQGCSLVSKTKYNVAGINHRVILATLTPNAKIVIGNSGISGSSICSVESIIIKDYCGIGANSNIYDTDFHILDPLKRRNQNFITEAKAKTVVIENDVWIASNVIILKGVTIGKGAVIGAGSVVTKHVPPYTLCAGNPAKVVRKIVVDK
jgi:acetyltransferase-like isoleucine patch superfamily enzyme